MAADNPFDPYHKWLGIPPKDQPPHHYRLLALQPFEDDEEVIHSAADQRMAHVRTFQSGTHSEASQKLLNELAAARLCLLKPDRKAAYDAELREKLAPPTAPFVPRDAAAPPTVDLPTTFITPPPGMTAPLAYSPQPAPWLGHPPSAAVPLGIPAAIPVHPPSLATVEPEEPEDLPLEFATGGHWRRTRRTRKNDGLPVLLALLAALLFVGMVAVALQTQTGQVQYSDDTSPKRPPPTQTRRASKPAPTNAAPDQAIRNKVRAKLVPKEHFHAQPAIVADPVFPLPSESAPPSGQLSGQLRKMPSVIDNADTNGFALRGEGWQTMAAANQAFRGTFAARPAGLGRAAAEWTFDGLEPGKRYDIFITWNDGTPNAGQQWYGVRDGALGTQYLVVDQSAAPQPGVECEGRPFQKLATVSLASNVLTVRLEGGDGEALRADAVLLVGTPD